MANSMSTINVNVPAKVKEEANNLFNNLGLNMSTAINLFLKKSLAERGIPFEVKEESPKPSKALLKALKEGEKIEKEIASGKRIPFNSPNELFASLDED